MPEYKNNELASQGIVYITGAGPGDIGLITVSAYRALEQADAVVYDYLINPDLLSISRDSCEKIYVGKKAGNHAITQEGINFLLYTLANSGKKVVRLKGGDPFVFGRGGEEALYLAERNIRFEVIPGITSGIAAAAYSGIPVTHRNISSTLTFISGHEADGKELNINWRALASLKGTLIFYMGVKNLSTICENLMKYGTNPKTPAAIIRYGTYTFQQEVYGTLESIENIAKEADIQAPALIMIGEVIRLKENIDWFKKKPLFGKRFLVTRSRRQASALASLLQEKGAEVVEMPTIEIAPMENYTELFEAFSRLITYNWIIFTSVNSVEVFFRLLYKQLYDTRALAFSKIACVGPETLKTLKDHGINADLMPANYTAEGIIEAFQKIDLSDSSVLIPNSNLARPLLKDELSKMGAQVDQISIYKNQIPDYTATELAIIFKDKFDGITFTSSSTVENFMQLINQYELTDYIKNSIKISIGPITSNTMQQHGLKADIEPTEHTIEAMVNAIGNYYITK